MTTNPTGHRHRLRERFLAGEAGSPTDLSVLELLPATAIARRDVQPLATALLELFGSLSVVLSASQEELASLSGIGPASIALLKAVDHIRTVQPLPNSPSRSRRTPS